MPDDDMPEAAGTPAAAAATAPTPAPAKIQLLASPPVAPLYRVVEVVRDSRGRLKEEGRIWHSDLNRARRFGRAVAANSAAHKVIVADAVGDALEELPVAADGDRGPAWQGWQQLPLPPLPPKKKSKKPRRSMARRAAAALPAAPAAPALPLPPAPPTLLAAPAADDPPTAADVELP